MVNNGVRSKKHLPHIAMGVGVLAASLLVSGCAAGGSGGGGDDDALKITFVAGVKGDPFYITMMCGAQAAAKELGASFDFQAPASFSPTDQIPIVDGVAAARPDILLIAPTDDEAMFSSIQQVADAGTKVVFVDTTLKDSTGGVAEVHTDDYQGGVEAANALAGLLGGKGKVLLLNFQPGVSTTEARGKGFTETAAKLGLELVGTEYGGTEIEKSTGIVDAALQQHSDLAGIFTTTDFGAQGAVTALRTADKIGDVKVVGFDASPIMVEQLKAGEIQTIVTQQARTIAQLGVEQGVAAVKGQPVKAKIEVETVTITQKDLHSDKAKSVLQMDGCS